MDASCFSYFRLPRPKSMITQCHSVSSIRICTCRLSRHMNHPVSRFALCNQGIKRPCRRPHDIRPRLIIFRVLKYNPWTIDGWLHQSLTDVLTGIVIPAGKILLTDIIKNIINTSHHLTFRLCVSTHPTGMISQDGSSNRICLLSEVPLPVHKSHFS